VSPGWLLVAVVLAFIPWYTSTVRVLLWTRFVGCPISARDAVRMALATDLGAAVLPTTAGGAYVRAGMMIERGVTPGAAGLLMILGTVQDVGFHLLAVPVALVLTTPMLVRLVPFAHRVQQPGKTGVMSLLILIVLAIVSLFLVREAGWWNSLTSRVRGTLVEALDAARSISERGKAVFGTTFLLAIVQWIAKYAVMNALLAALGIAINPLWVFVLQWILTTLGAIVPTPGGSGGLEAGFLLLFRGIVPASMLGVTMLVWRLLTFYCQLAVGALLFSLLSTRFVDAEPEPQAYPAA
jgi:uncharacterized protein (TIRG00374 family)